MLNFLYWATWSFVFGVVVSSLFEWILHRFIMHRPVGVFRYPFERHALIHHRIFKADHTYHLIDEKDKHTIPMAWWNGPALIAVCQIPFVLAALRTGAWWLPAGTVVAFIAYYAAYEYIHWCMHLPRRRIVERSGIFFRLNGHHLLHHRYMNKNFNVVLPLADLCLGTLLLRSKIHFPQAQSPALPNVQPGGIPAGPAAFPNPSRLSPDFMLTVGADVRRRTTAVRPCVRLVTSAPNKVWRFHTRCRSGGKLDQQKG